MKYIHALSEISRDTTRYKRLTRWPLYLLASALIAGCASPEPRVADGDPKKCHAGHILSCDVRGHGQRKSYSNCRCISHFEINTGLSNY